MKLILNVRGAVVAFLAGACALQVAGCQPGNSSGSSLADSLTMFAADFLRNSLAAYLV